MLLYIFLVAILGLTYMAYFWMIKPKRQMAHYAKMFRNSGFKVRQFPYKLFGAPYTFKYTEGSKLKNDALYYHKNEYYSTDVIVSNVLHDPIIVFTNEELIKEATKMDKVMIVEKCHGTFETLFTFIKHGLLSIEKDVWKSRRKIFSQVFNFDFITSHIPMMINIADEIFDEL